MITKPKKWKEMKGSMWHKCKATVVLCIWKVKPINYCALYCWEKAKQMISKVREKELKCKFHVADMHVLCPVLERQFFRKRVFYWFEEESCLLLNNIRNKKVPGNVSLSALTPTAMEKSHSGSLDPPQACTNKVI